jgi:hypothetical protein
MSRIVIAIKASHITNIKLCLLLSYFLGLISTAKMEVIYPFEASVNSYNTIRQFSYIGDYSKQRLQSSFVLDPEVGGNTCLRNVSELPGLFGVTYRKMTLFVFTAV